MKISTTKAEVMAFQGKELIRTKITISDRTVEQVSHLNYLGNDKNYYIDVKLGTFQMGMFGKSMVFLETRYVEIQN